MFVFLTISIFNAQTLEDYLSKYTQENGIKYLQPFADVFGWGIRHSIDQYLPNLPLDLAVGFYRQSFTLGEYMNAAATFVNLQAS